MTSGLRSGKRKAGRSATLLSTYALVFLVHSSVLAQALYFILVGGAQASTATTPATGEGSLYGPMLLAALETLIACTLVYLGYCNATKRLTLQQQHDCNLVFWGLMMPMANVAWHYTLPHLSNHYDSTKRVWPIIFATIMGAGVVCCRMPLAHLTFMALAILPPFW